MLHFVWTFGTERDNMNSFLIDRFLLSSERNVLFPSIRRLHFGELMFAILLSVRLSHKDSDLLYVR